MKGKFIKFAVAIAFGLLCFLAVRSNAWAYGVYQTGNTDTSVTVNWEGTDTKTNFRLGYAEVPKIPDGTSYEKRSAALQKARDKAESNAKNGQITVGASVHAHTITGLKPQKEYYVYLYYNSSADYESHNYLSAFTKIKKVTNVAQEKWWKYINIVDVKWDAIPSSSSVDYEVVFMNAKGKVIEKKKTTGTSYSHSIKNNQIYLIKVRATRKPGYDCKGMSNEVSAWSDTQYLFTQPTIIASNLTNSKLTVMWNKIAGVTSYDVYMSTKLHKGYKKVASVKAKRNAVTIKKFNKKKLSKLKKKKYYVYIVPNKKVKNKIVKKDVTYSYQILKGKNRISETYK